MSIICTCGEKAYTRDELTAMQHPTDPTFGDQAGLWFSLLGPDDYYCAGEDDVLTREEVKKAKRITTKAKRVIKNRAAIIGSWLRVEEPISRRYMVFLSAFILILAIV